VGGPEVGEVARGGRLFRRRGLAGEGLEEERVDLGGVGLRRVEGRGPALGGVDDKGAVQERQRLRRTLVASRRPTVVKGLGPSKAVISGFSELRRMVR
jgi:hypothetical protein